MENMNPYDGVRVESMEIPVDGELALSLLVRQQGDRAHDLQVTESPDTVVGRGQHLRNWALLEAMARFLNAGGQIDEIQAIADRISQLFEENGITLSMPDDWYLLHTLQGVPQVYHIFANDVTGQGLIWYEDVYVEAIPLEEVDEHIGF